MTPPPPAPTLAPLWEGALTGATWTALMAFVGILAIGALVARPALEAGAGGNVRRRLGRFALVFGVAASLLAYVSLAHDAAEDEAKFDFGAAWAGLFHGTGGWADGLELVMLVAAVGLCALGLVKRVGRMVTAATLVLAALALVATKYPTSTSKGLGRTVFDYSVWVLHLLGGGVWIGGLIALVAVALPGGLGAIATADRSAFWSRAIRRFSIAAMSSVAAITLSGLWLYWVHVDGPTQLLTTLYGRVLGVKILLFGAMLGLGVLNQFWLHPRIDRLRAAGDERPLRTLLAREFPRVVAAEVALGVAVLMVAPFLSGSARNEAYQREHPKVVDGKYKKAPTKQVSTSTWVYGSLETVLVITVMGAGFTASGRIARRRAPASA